MPKTPMGYFQASSYHPVHPREQPLREAADDFTTAVEVLVGKFALTSSELSLIVHQWAHRFSQRMVAIERRQSQVPE